MCHKRAVADFEDSAKIKEINSIENLCTLCPAHHWELDNNALDEEAKNKLVFVLR